MRAAAFILLLAASPASAAPGDAGALDADFAPEVPRPSIALGPVARGRPFASLDVGWLRSGLRFDVGFGAGFDLGLRADAMLLYKGMSGQNGLHVALRWTWVEGVFRTSLEASAGKYFQPLEPNLQGLTTLRGDVTVGLVSELGAVYGRVALRGIGGEELPDRTRFRQELEAGGGVERGFGRLVLGAEAFVLSRSGHPGLGEWRLRAGMAF